MLSGGMLLECHKTDPEARLLDFAPCTRLPAQLLMDPTNYHRGVADDQPQWHPGLDDLLGLCTAFCNSLVAIQISPCGLDCLLL